MEHSFKGYDESDVEQWIQGTITSEVKNIICNRRGQLVNRLIKTPEPDIAASIREIDRIIELFRKPKKPTNL